MIMQKKKRGPKPLGGIRIIMRLLPGDLEILDKEQQRSGRTRTELLRRALWIAYTTKRRDVDRANRS